MLESTKREKIICQKEALKIKVPKRMVSFENRNSFNKKKKPIKVKIPKTTPTDLKAQIWLPNNFTERVRELR